MNRIIMQYNTIEDTSGVPDVPDAIASGGRVNGGQAGVLPERQICQLSKVE